jgi:hypothetical protein
LPSSSHAQAWTGQSDIIQEYWPNIVAFWDYALSFVDSDGVWVTTNVLADINVGVHCPTAEVPIVILLL